MKRYIIGCILGAAVIGSHTCNAMHATQTAPRFFNEPSFVKVIRALFTPILTRLAPAPGGVAGANPMPIIVPAWWTAGGNGKIGMSAATAAALTSLFIVTIGAFVYWKYIKGQGYSPWGLTKRGASATRDTLFSTAGLCLTTMGKVLLFGLSFWIFESAIFYTLERMFHISLNNPQLYNILLTLMAAGFYALITNSVKENMREARIATSIPQEYVPIKDVDFQASFSQNADENRQIPLGPVTRFISQNNANAFNLCKPLLIIGQANSGKTDLLNDILTKARTESYGIPCLHLKKTKTNSYAHAQKAFEDALLTAEHRGKDKVIIAIDDLDHGVTKKFIDALITQSKENTRQLRAKTTSIKVIILATAKPSFLQTFDAYRDEFEITWLTPQEEVAQERDLTNRELLQLLLRQNQNVIPPFPALHEAADPRLDSPSPSPTPSNRPSFSASMSTLSSSSNDVCQTQAAPAQESSVQQTVTQEVPASTSSLSSGSTSSTGSSSTSSVP